MLFPWLKLFGGVLGTGIAVKLMDDHLDGDWDRISETETTRDVLGPGAVPYAMVALTVAAWIRFDVTVALFFSAYGAGMVHEWGERMPTKLPAWLESSLAFAGAVVGAGLALAGGALCLMIFVQCVDDIVDATIDRRSGARNFVHTLGLVETYLLAGSTLLFALSLAPALSVAVFVALAIIDELFRRMLAGTAMGTSKTREDGEIG